MTYPTSVKILLWIVNALAEIIYLPIHVFRLFKNSQKCPPVQHKILLLSAEQLAERIRSRQISSVVVVNAYISRIKEVNPIINAVIEERFEAALEDARQADNLIQTTQLTKDQIKEKYPLLGVPITIKGSIAVKGMTHSAGRPDHLVRAETDAVSVKRAKDAGVIPLLLSNVPELCLNWETTNKLVGATANPYDTCRTPGGSSGGEASLIGCGASVIGIGSDIGGSLRLPAHYCGVWGHKPSPFVVSNVGHYPDCKNKDDWNSVFALGPIARYATDLRFLLNTIAEPSMKSVLNLDKQVDVRQIKLYYIEDIKSILTNSVNSYVIQAIQKVINHFDVISSTKCTKINVQLMQYCAELSYLRLLNIDEVENLFEGYGEGSYSELFRFFCGKSQHEFSSIVYGLLRRNFQHVSPKTVNSFLGYLQELHNDLVKILGDDGVLIMPVSPSEATYQGDIYRKLFNAGYLSVFNALGFPATSCPVMKSENVLPIGIQVVAAPNLDRLTLAVAEELERVFGGWKF